ncbi:MAG TPA: DMT family transporter [Bacteroidales bacterium]|nr:DMT family transporter [Bacteroidales bacterium]
MGIYQGEIFALITSVCWTISSLSYESAGKKIGSVPMNLIRMSMALIYISLYTLIFRGFVLPVDADFNTWLWLLLSGLVGFVIGDIMLFQSFVIIGARISMLVMSMVPPITAIMGWIILGETMTGQQIFAMMITISGIVMVLLKRKKNNSVKNKSGLSTTVVGLLLAFGGALGQAGGLVISKKGMGNYDAFAASQIRIIAGVVGYIIIISFAGLWKKTLSGLKNVSAMKAVSLGSFVGPFLGVSFSLLAIKYTTTGIAATLTSLAPIIIIFPSVIINKEKVAFMEVFGAVISVIGVALFFL